MTDKNIIVVDDEPLAVKRILKLLQNIEHTNCLGTASNIAAAQQLLQNLSVDVILLDIDMPGGSGLELAAKLHQQRLIDKTVPVVIFITAHEQHALQAFDHGVSDYLLKPVRQSRLRDALERLPAVAEQPSTITVVVNFAGQQAIIPLHTISCCIAEEKYTRIHYDSHRSILADYSLQELEERFDDYFVRIHRSALAAKTRITGIQKKISGFSVILRDCHEQPPISRRQRTLLNKLLNI